MRDGPPACEALSYAWGFTDDPVRISVLDGGSHLLPITQNLDCALRHLRYKDKPRVLWVNAICINQSDLTERGHQVERMADVFRLADRVVAFLGPEVDDSTNAIRLVKELSSKMEVD